MAENLFGIIACPLFEDEIVHELKNDDSVERVYIIENEFSSSMHGKAVEHLDKPVKAVGKDSIGDLEDREGTVLVWMKDIGLHVYPDELRDAVIDTLGTMDAVCSTILLFYGLCGNALKDFDDISAMCEAKIFLLRDEHEGRIADDCVAAVIGGASNYLQLMKDQTGVMYMSPGWADHWEDLTADRRMLEGSGMTHREFSTMLFEMAGYEKVLKIHTPLEDSERFDAKVREFADIFDFRIEEMDGNLDVIDHTYTNARKVHLGNAA